jgi:hypothetical protein
MNIVTHPKLKEELFKRWKDLGIKVADVIKDAEERGMKISSPRMSRYKTGTSKEAISPRQLLWLSIRWGIPVSINIGNPVIEKGTVVYKVLPYDEAKCLAMLKRTFGDGKK